MNETSKWWWIGANHNTSNSSPWLNTTLSENKPKLIAMVEDLYRSHRSLAQKHDLLIKTSSLNSDSTAITHQPATSSGRNCVKKQSLMVKLKVKKTKLLNLAMIVRQ
ncbi:unnamed protein product [Arabidopsis lyrata]|nr:unnamed protein product [Arabidopsis lyrata]